MLLTEFIPALVNVSPKLHSGNHMKIEVRSLDRPVRVDSIERADKAEKLNVVRTRKKNSTPDSSG